MMITMDLQGCTTCMQMYLFIYHACNSLYTMCMKKWVGINLGKIKETFPPYDYCTLWRVVEKYSPFLKQD